MKNSKGITIIALIITIIVMLILVTVVVNFGTSEIDKAKIEDLKATMLLIKGRVQISIDKENFEKDYVESGVIKINENLTIPETASKQYNLANLNSILGALDDKTGLYIWEQEAMDNNGIDVEITAEDFFVIDYNKMEVYSSLGYKVNNETAYSLTELQKISDKL